MKLSKLIPSTGIDWLILVILAVSVSVIFVGTFGWPSWVPWSVEHKLAARTSELSQEKDDHLVDTSQAELDKGVSEAEAATKDNFIIIRERANAAVTTIAAAPPADRDGALIEFLCNGSSLRTADPECDPYRHRP